MPERSPYDEAMALSQARLKVLDPDLKQGKVETITVKTVAGPMERPWGVQGGFAVVYKFRTQSGKLRALRCFLVQMTPDTQFRYERIGSYFTAHAPDITVGFKYYDPGILLKEQVGGQLQNKTYPVIEMEWIEGVTLVDYIHNLCVKRDRVGLEDVANQWLAIMGTLRAANISHGDLAGVNVMVRNNGRLVLVDYDGVYIPDFAGLPQIVLGQSDYQHPQMNLRPFNEHTDDFSALVIYAALAVLKTQPELWVKYTRCNAQGFPLDANLLFKHQDFVDPDRSVLFADLENNKDAHVREVILKLKQACLQPITEPVPSIASPEQQALVKLEQAIQSGDDEAIAAAWNHALLDKYGPAQYYRTRVTDAQKVVQALKDFQAALQTRSLRQIVNAYNPAFNNCKSFTMEQTSLLVLAFEFTRAYDDDDDQAMVPTWEAIEQSRFKGKLTLTPQEQQRVKLAQQRSPALLKFRMALMNKSVQSIVDNYDTTLLDNCTTITRHEHNLLQVAQDFVQAYRSEDDQGIVAASEAILNFSYRSNFTFTPLELQRMELAQQRKIALVKFRLGLMSKLPRQIITSFDWILDDCTNVTTQEREILKLAKGFVQAYHKNEDEAIAAAWEAIQKASYQTFFTFSSAEKQRINTIQRRKTALAKFRFALASQMIQQIVDAYDAVLDDYKGIAYEERMLLQLARDFVQACQNNDDQAIVLTCEEIQGPRYRQSFALTEQEQQRISLAQQRKAALIKFRLTMMNKNIQQLVAAYNPILDGCGNITQEERELVKLARSFMQAYQHDNDQAISSAWSAIQQSPQQKSFVFTAQELERITLARTRNIAGGPHA